MSQQTENKEGREREGEREEREQPINTLVSILCFRSWIKKVKNKKSFAQTFKKDQETFRWIF